jgi:hypothetical protein
MFGNRDEIIARFPILLANFFSCKNAVGFGSMGVKVATIKLARACKRKVFYDSALRMFQTL